VVKVDIKKVLNNNVVLTEGENEQELVVMGRGLAFQKKVGDEIEQKKIEKTFVLENQAVSDKLAELLNDVSETYLQLSDKIITYAKSQLPNRLDDYIYVALTDHLSFAISRHKQGMQLKNPLLWEIRKFYKKEYEIARHALDIIQEDTGYVLEEDEAGSIALHLLNSQISGEGLESMVHVTKMVNDILNIVKYHFGMELDESAISYERFLTHLRFFAFRLVKNETGSEHPDDFLYEQVKRKYKEPFHCSEKITKYVEKTHGRQISKDELVYLTLHIYRVTQRHQWHTKKTD
jgi:beta-glucoside operon transcriptional antiterminator